MQALPTVGLVPAAGFARRLGVLAHSKELLPIGNRGIPARPVCLCLLGALAEAGVRRVCLILRSAKSDIAAQLGEGSEIDLELEYLQIEPTNGVPYTLLAALPRYRDFRVVIGFPDILFRPRNCLAKILNAQESSDADLVLALMPSDNPSKADMVELDKDGKIVGFQIKPLQTDLVFTWILATWKPTFTAFFESFVAALGESPPVSMLAAGELQVSTIIQAAIDAKLKVEAVTFPEAAYLDIGTPEDLLRARKEPEVWFSDSTERDSDSIDPSSANSHMIGDPTLA